MPTFKSLQLPVLALITLSGAHMAYGLSSVVLYADDFSGSSAAALNTTTPDVITTGTVLGANHGTANQSWTASSNWLADGSNTAGVSSNAFMPFSPQSGYIYTLSLDLNPTAGLSRWLAVGFTSTNSTSIDFDDTGAAGWMIARDNRASPSAIMALGGIGSGNSFSYDPDPDIAGAVQARIVLDTRATNWTVDWYVDNPGYGSIATFTYSSGNPAINYVSFGSYLDAEGIVDNFELNVIPEMETSSAMLGLGVIIGTLLWRRRKVSLRGQL